MSEKPQHTEPGSPELDMLNEILDRTMPQISDPPEESQQESGVEAENVSRETPEEKKAAPPAPEKNKRSSVYVYLAVLFGAAFLMLLLAYFVQQRNNATALDDLRSTSTASRQELLEEIQRLEEENESLAQEKQTLKEELEEEQDRAARLKETSQQYWGDYFQMLSWYDQSNLLDCLERANDAGDYLLMDVMVQDTDVIFNQSHPDFSNEYLIPAQEAQYLELREELFQKGGIMVMEGRWSEEDRSDYTEFPVVGENIYDEGVIKTAHYLYAIVRHYAIDPGYAARLIAVEFGPNTGNREILYYGGVFKKATVEWFEEIRSDLIDQEYLVKTESGVVILKDLEEQYYTANITSYGDLTDG